MRTTRILTVTLALSGCGLVEDHEHEVPPDQREGVEISESAVLTCNPRSDQGYTRGAPTPITVVTVDGKPVEINTANAFVRMRDDAARDGVHIRVVSGFRTYAEQQYLYNCYRNCSCNNCNLAARPGYSNHNSGLALDLNSSAPGVSSWLRRNASRYNFHATVRGEPWHYEYQGPDLAGPCTAGGSVATCEEIPAQGGDLEEDGDCATLGGPVRFLRSVSGEGHDDAYVWTGATGSSRTSNYAEWTLKLERSGRYRVEAYVAGGTGTSQQATYTVRHADGEDSVRLDQSATDGFASIGHYRFEAGASYSVRINDNTGEPSSLGRRIVFDALRITPESSPPSSPPSTSPPPSSPPPDPNRCEQFTGQALLEEDGNCAELLGPTRYLRSESGGHGGSYVWTGATSSREFNAAVWSLDPAESGLYRLEAYVGAGTGTSHQARYVVSVNGGVNEVVVNQSTADGFIELGYFQLMAGSESSVKLADFTGESSSSSRRVVFDAIRVTRVSSVPCATVGLRAGVSGLNVRLAPSTSSRALGVLRSTESVQRLATVSGQTISGDPDWHRVRLGGNTGYVSARYAECR